MLKTLIKADDVLGLALYLKNKKEIKIDDICIYTMFVHKKDSTMLAYAIQKNSIGCVHLLLELGANVNYVNPFLDSPLGIACSYGHLEIVNMLLQSGAELELCKDQMGWTPLLAAYDRCNLEVAETLIKAGANILAKDGVGRTAIAIASILNQAEHIETLIKLGANVNEPDCSDSTPLHHAVLGLPKIECVEVLLSGGANVHAKDNFGGTPLHVMCNNGNHPDIVEKLLMFGADPNATDVSGWTPLHVLCNAHTPGCTRSISLLLAYGANKEIVNKDNEKPIDLIGDDHRKELIPLFNTQNEESVKNGAK